METLSRKGTTPFLKHGIRELFEQIMSMSRKRQYQLLTEHGQTEKTDFKEVDHLNYKNAKIVFQGTEGAYSQLALNEYFGEKQTVIMWIRGLGADEGHPKRRGRLRCIPN